MIKPYGPTTEPCLILLVIAVTLLKNDIIHFRMLGLELINN